ncbi:MAG: RraA family protein [Defluviitaleaceae bacterium]|nr:RraA family protein [Defluviitaleaceae bacterium]
MHTYKYTGHIGFCVGNDIPRPQDTAIFQRLAECGSCLLSDGLKGFNVMDAQIKPVAKGVRIAGPALTVRLRPGDNLMLHKAIGLAKPGDVIVVDTCQTMDVCVLGELMATAAFQAGVSGIVIDGAIRDVEKLVENNFPVFAKGAVPVVGDKDGPGEINLPISCGGVSVLPGYYIVGDDNGVVVVPPYQVDEILSGAEKKNSYEVKRREEIRSGVITKPDIDQKLRNLGVIE